LARSNQRRYGQRQIESTMVATRQTDVRKSPLGGLARRLVNEGLLPENKAVEIQEAAVKQREAFVTQLVASKAIPARKVAEAASREFGIPLIDLKAVDLAQAPVRDVAEKLIRKHHALPMFKRGNRLYVGVSDPTNLQALDEIKFNTGMVTEAILVEEDKLAKAIEDALSAVDSSMEGLDDADLEALEVSGGDDNEREVDVASLDTDDAPVVRFVNKVMLDAINKGASDIHFEPYEKKYRVRLRQDGVLRELASPPVGLGMRLSARLKVLARLDLADHRLFGGCCSLPFF